MNEALKQLENLLGNSAAGVRAFPPNSRYNAVPVRTHIAPDGKEITCLSRRFIAHTGLIPSVGTHFVAQGDRLDNVAMRYLGDPEQYWRLCDANGVLRPDELVEAIGRGVRIGLPDGIPPAP